MPVSRKREAISDSLALINNNYNHQGGHTASELASYVSTFPSVGANCSAVRLTLAMKAAMPESESLASPLLAPCNRLSTYTHCSTRPVNHTYAYIHTYILPDNKRTVLASSERPPANSPTCRLNHFEIAFTALYLRSSDR